MESLIYNLHNHTPFSDGAYTVDEICEAHLSFAGVSVDGVGFSDYLFATPWSKVPTDAREFERIFAAEARDYVEQILAARERWAGRLDVLVGCELNWSRNAKFLDQVITLLDGVDYVLFEGVDWAGLTTLANRTKRWPFAVGLSRTDITRQMPRTSMDQIVRTLANAHIFFELNSEFMPLRDSDPWFNVLPHHRVGVSLGTDTHDDLACIRQLGDMCRYLERRGLDGRLVAPRRREIVPLPQPLVARSA